MKVFKVVKGRNGDEVGGIPDAELVPVEGGIQVRAIRGGLIVNGGNIWQGEAMLVGPSVGGFDVFDRNAQRLYRVEP